MKITGRQRTVLIWLGYVTFFVTCFVLFCYLTFPYDRLRDYIVQRAASGSSDWKLKIGEPGPSFPAGLSIKDVVLTKRAAEAGGYEPEIKLDELTVGTSLLSLLLGTTDVDFSLEAGDGEVEGSYSMAKEDGPTQIEAELDEIDVGRLGLGAFLGLPVKGIATGTIDLTLAKEPADTSGEIELKVEGLELGDGKAKVPIPGMGSGLTLDTLRAGTLELKMTVKEAVATIEKLEAEGDDIELSGSGSLRLLPDFKRSRPDITIGVKFSDSYTQKSPRTKAAFELMKNNPQIKRATGPDGTLRFKLIGSLDNIRANPAGPARGSSRRNPRRPPRKPD